MTVATPAATTRSASPWWFRPARPELLAYQRIATGLFAVGYLAIRFTHITGVRHFEADRFDPVGPVALLVDRPVAGSVVVGVTAVALASAVAVTVGWRYRIAAPVCALAVLWSLTYLHSWGVVLHTDNLLTLHLLVLAVVPAADALSLDERRGAGRWTPSPSYRWPLVVLGAITALGYVVAGWAKLRNGGLDWVDGEVLRAHVASDNLRKELLGDLVSPLAGPLVGVSWIWGPMAVGALVLELGAPLAVIVHRWARPLAVVAWTFHLAVLGIMSILFPYQLLGVALLPWVLAAHELEPTPDPEAP
ncbi:MAG: HTTM domain-containing protein [Actinomycetota bacterium]